MAVKESPGEEFTHIEGDLGSIPGSGRCPGEGKGCRLQYSGLENSMDYLVHGDAKSKKSHLQGQCVCVCVCVLSHFSGWQLCDPMDLARQAPLSMGFSRQEYWSGLPCPPPGDLPSPRMEPESISSLALATSLPTSSATWRSPHGGQTRSQGREVLATKPSFHF